MAKAGKPRHSGSTRSAPTINHEPLSTKKDNGKATNDAQDEAKAKSTLPDQKALPTPQSGKTINTDANSTVPPIENTQKPDAAKTMIPENKTPNDQTADKNAPNNTLEKAPKSKKGSSFLGGIAGGVIALVLAGGLQWSGVLPVVSQNGNTQKTDNSQIAALQQQIDSLKTSLEAQKTASAPDDKALQDVLDKANAATETANQALNQVDENAQTLATLKTTINSLGAQNGDASSLSALSAQLTSLEDKAALTDELNKRVAENQGTLEQIRTRLNAMETSVADVKNMGDRVTTLEANEKTQSANIATLQQNAQTFEERILSESSTDQTRLIVANALKDAVNRGGSYINELQTFEKVAPQDYSLDLLKTYAKTGLPTGAELSKQFTKVADQIAATQYAAAEDAGMGDKLWSSARQLVITRPVGNVEGSTPGDIAARMEVAIEKGDYESAIAQWETLPDNAKAVSNSFMKTLKARNDADSLLNRLITAATQLKNQPANERKM